VSSGNVSSGHPRSLAYFATLLLTLVATGALYLLYLSGLQAGGFDAAGLLLGRDFLNLHFAGTLLGQGEMTTLFDQQAYAEAMRAHLGRDYTIHNWSYPPHMFPVAQLAASLPYFVALGLWTLIGVALTCVGARLAGVPLAWLLPIVLSPAVTVNLLAGQNGTYTAGLLLLALTLAERRRWLGAGLCWALLTVKPHLGLLALPMVLLRRQWRIVAAGAVCLSVIVALTLALYGAEPWRLFLTETTAQQRVVVEEWRGLLLKLMPTAFIAGRLAGLETGAAYLLHGGVAVLTLLLLWRSWPGQGGTLRDWITWFSLGTFLLLPYSFYYDLVIVQVMLVLWVGDPKGLFPTRSEAVAQIAWYVAWFLPYLCYLAAFAWNLQPAPVLLLLMLFGRVMAQRRAEPA